MHQKLIEKVTGAGNTCNLEQKRIYGNGASYFGKDSQREDRNISQYRAKYQPYVPEICFKSIEHFVSREPEGH